MAVENIFRITADLKHAVKAPKPVVTQADDVRFEVDITDGGKKWSPQDYTNLSRASLASTRRDGQVVVTDGVIGKKSISFRLGKNAIELPGEVAAAIQLYSGTDSRVTTIKFTFEVAEDPTGEGYVPSTDEMTFIESVMSDAQAKIDELSKVDVVQLTGEVTTARGGKASLDARLNDVDAQMASTSTQLVAVKNTKADRAEVTSLAVEKADRSYVEQQISNIGSSTPKGIYATLASLQSAYPNGTTGVYVVSTDGKWYYWTGSAWVSGGVYQATAIGEKTISERKLSDDLFKSIYKPTTLTWEYGSVSSTNGELTEGTTRIRTQRMPITKDTVIDFNNPDNLFYFLVAKYDKHGTYSTTGFITVSKYTFTEDCEAIIVLAYRSNGNIDSISSITPAIKVYSLLASEKMQVKADTKYVNDLFSLLYTTPSLNWSLGSVSTTDGKLTDSTSRIRTDKVAVKKNTVIRFSDLDNLYYYNLFIYDKYSFKTTGFIRDSEYKITEDSEVIVIVAYKSNQNISNVSLLSSLISVHVPSTNIPTDSPVVKNGKVPISSTYYWSDITFVREEIWAFRPSDDNMALSPGVGAVYIFDQQMNFKKRLKHNFGHVNTADYQQNTDTLIFGNGSGIYGTDGVIHIITGIKHWADLPSDTLLDMGVGISGSNIVNINVGRTFGDKVNVCWGEDNNGHNNICYVLSNDNANVRRLLLGMGANQFENGQFISEVSSTQFNGTYRVIGEFSTESLDVNQGTCYYNGYLWSAIGHDGLLATRMKLNVDGTITQEIRHEKAYKEDGTPYTYASEGIAIKDGIIYHGTFNQINGIHKYPVF